MRAGCTTWQRAPDAATAARYIDVPAARLYLAGAAWLASGRNSGPMVNIARRVGLPLDANAWRGAAVAAAPRNYDPLSEIDASLSFGDSTRTVQALVKAKDAHFPLEEQRTR